MARTLTDLRQLEALGYSVAATLERGDGNRATTVSGLGGAWLALSDQDAARIFVEATNHAALVGKMSDGVQFFSDTYRNWDTLTAAQKNTANKQAMRALANLIRYALDDTTSGGD